MTRTVASGGDDVFLFGMPVGEARAGRAMVPLWMLGAIKSRLYFGQNLAGSISAFRAVSE
jgi:hypothetical protein